MPRSNSLSDPEILPNSDSSSSSWSESDPTGAALESSPESDESCHCHEKRSKQTKDFVSEMAKIYSNSSTNSSTVTNLLSLVDDGAAIQLLAIADDQKIKEKQMF